MEETTPPAYFGEWLKNRRKELDLTQAELAQRAGCSAHALRKIESGERKPSKQLAGLLAKSLELPAETQTTFIRVARGELPLERLPVSVKLSHARTAEKPLDSIAPVNLPVMVTPFFGREPEMAVLSRIIVDPLCRLLTLTGGGGIGKTRLAIELASKHQAMFPGGVYYVPLAALDESEFIIPSIADAFGISLTDTETPILQLINELARNHKQALLLVLDNLEHLLVHGFDQDAKDEASLVLTEMLQRLPFLKILVTSRERINLQGEWTFELHGLTFPAEEQYSQGENYSAVALFVQRVGQLKADFEVQPDEWPSLVRICQLVEGAPLAIELAASWVRMLSIDEIAEEIASNLDFLATPARDLPERHQSLKATFNHSWKLLSSEEQQALCRLAIFRGGFQREAAEQVAGTSLPILMSLFSKSLLLSKEDGRYDLLMLIRQYALEKCQNTGYFEETRDQHLAYFLSLALEAHTGLREVHQAEWFNRIEQEHDNIRAALDWAFMARATPERVEKGLRLVTSIYRFWPGRGHLREGINWLERGLQASDAITLTRARALRYAGWLINHGDDNQRAIPLLEENVAISRRLNDHNCQANALDTLGDVAWRNGEFEIARAYYA